MSFPMRPLAAACALAWAPWAALADDDVALPSVVVSGQRNPDQSTLTQPDLARARQTIDLTPGGVGIVAAEQFERGRVSTLSDALGMATGVFVQPRFGAEESRISIRGSGLQRTFHGRGLKLLQDGVPLNLADGSFDFQAVEALSARYVEIWRGANALQYGSATLGGAINFVSPNGYNADPWRLRAEGGSFGYWRAIGAAGLVHENFDAYLMASGFGQDSYREHAVQSSERVFANLGWQLAPDLETRFYLGQVRSRSELPGGLTKQQFETDPRMANPANVALDQRRDIDWTRLSNRTAWRIDAQQQLDVFVYAAWKQLDHPIFQVFQQDNRDLGLEARWVDASLLDGRRNRFIAGFNTAWGRTDENRYLNAAGQPGAPADSSLQRATNLELYGEWQHEVQPQWWLVGGVHGINATRRFDDRLVIAGNDQSFDQRYSGWSPVLGFRYDAAPTVQWFANIAGTYEPPSFGELTGGLAPVLNDAQRGTSVEFGTRGRTPQLQWDLVAYQVRLRGELLSIGGANGMGTTINADRTVHRGIEAGLGGPLPVPAFDWQLNALLNDFRFDGDALYGNARLPGIPRGTLRAELGWTASPALRLALLMQAATDAGVDYAGTLFAPGYGLWGLRANGSLNVGGTLNWFVEGRNLGNKDYVATTGVIRDAQLPGAPLAQFFPGDGRAFYAGLDWRF